MKGSAGWRTFGLKPLVIALTWWPRGPQPRRLALRLRGEGVADKLRRCEAEADFFTRSEPSNLHAIHVLIAARPFWHAIEQSADFRADAAVTIMTAHTIVAAVIPKHTCASSDSSSVRHTAFLGEFRNPCTLLIR